ncbi:MAG: hypothetical protein M1825_000860 [Sarcosagium campestre]|nr:MAG: hypothetical protein M1825_000860 [Sarcosagium campestre]
MTLDTAPVFPSADESAAQDNHELMRAFEEALEREPAADLMALIPEAYRRRHDKLQLKMLESDAARWNQKTLNELQITLNNDPEIDLLSSFPVDYRRRKGFLNHSNTKLPKSEVIFKDPTFREKLDVAERATVVHPLSHNVESILARYAKTDAPVESPEESLACSIIRMLLESPIVWEFHAHGLVVRCDPSTVAKVVTGNNDYTEYTALQFLETHAPDIPAPRPLGLVNLDPFRVIFMTYIPSTTLEEAWPLLSHEQKLSVQGQLDRILCSLRTIKRCDGQQTLGGVAGEGVKHAKVDLDPHTEAISKSADFEDFRFSVPHHGSTTYVRFLRSFLAAESVHGSVFTHGDIRPANIMVHRDQDDGTCIVRGIIDWEDAGFYPDYHESLQMTRNLSAINENDWYLYLPPCVAPPAKFPVRWLVDRLWEFHVITT